MKTEMNMKERVQMVKAMEFIARQVNDEGIFMGWLTLGVADGDIPYGDLDYRGTGDEVDEELEYYCEDAVFADLMDTFVRTMKRVAQTDTGLYCDGVVSKNMLT